MTFRYGCIKRKNMCGADIGLVTTFCPFTTTGNGKLVFQSTAEPRFGENCKMHPVAFVGQLKTMFAPWMVLPRLGAFTVSVPVKRLKL